MAETYNGWERKEVVTLAVERGLGGAGKTVDIVKKLVQYDKDQEQAAADAAAAAAAPRTRVQKAPKGRRLAQPVVAEEIPDDDAAEDQDEDLWEYDQPVRRQQRRQYTVGDLSLSDLKALLAQESKAAMETAVQAVNGVIIESTTVQKETKAAVEAATLWPDAPLGSKTQEYDTLKLAARDLHVLIKTVDDKNLVGKLEKIAAGLKQRAVTLFIGEKVGWSFADILNVPVGSIFKDEEKRIEKALDESRKRKKDAEEPFRGGRQWMGAQGMGAGAGMGAGMGAHGRGHRRQLRLTGVVSGEQGHCVFQLRWSSYEAPRNRLGKPPA